MNVKEHSDRGEDPPATSAPQERRTQAERSEATRGALIEAARTLFAERGYAAVGTEEIVKVAGVTRGALYHHFTGKRDLFEAVYEEVEAQLAERIAAGAIAANAESPLDAMRAGAEMFLQACTEPEAQQIALLDGPSVLGWDRWREIAAEHGLGLIEATVQAAIDAGAIAKQPVRPLAHVLMGALDEAAMLVARADDPEQMRTEVSKTLDFVLAGLRTG
ncbi:MAG TPA: helix-turn-helix domain-containing protein [Solirubrobacterales bacterium]|jgi:AcrR family transcriptional regulator